MFEIIGRILGVPVRDIMSLMTSKVKHQRSNTNTCALVKVGTFALSHTRVKVRVHLGCIIAQLSIKEIEINRDTLIH